MSNAGSVPREDAIENDEDKIRQDTAKLAEDGEELYEDGVSEVRRALSRLEDEISDLYDMVAERSADSIEAIEEAVHASPWYSLGIAFAAGCVTTLLLGRRR